MKPSSALQSYVIQQDDGSNPSKVFDSKQHDLSNALVNHYLKENKLHYHLTFDNDGQSISSEKPDVQCSVDNQQSQVTFTINTDNNQALESVENLICKIFDQRRPGLKINIQADKNLDADAIKDKLKGLNITLDKQSGTLHVNSLSKAQYGQYLNLNPAW